MTVCARCRRVHWCEDDAPSTQSAPPATSPVAARAAEALRRRAAVETAASATLRADLYAGGVASASPEKWSALLAADAGSLLDAPTLASDKAAIAAYFH